MTALRTLALFCLLAFTSLHAQADETVTTTVVGPAAPVPTTTVVSPAPAPTTTVVSPGPGPGTPTTIVTSPTTTTVTTSPDITTPAPARSHISGRAMIVTPVPSLKEVIHTPQGYVDCFTVQASWNKNAWIPEHKVCRYQNTPGQTVTYEGVAWIDSYWACTKFSGTTCTKWEWKPGHWVKTLEVY